MNLVYRWNHVYICTVASINYNCKATLCQSESLEDFAKKHNKYIGGLQEIHEKRSTTKKPINHCTQGQ